MVVYNRLCSRDRSRVRVMKSLQFVSGTAAGRVRYVAFAWLVALVPSLAVFALRVAMGGASPALPPLADLAGFAFYSIVVAPLVETALMIPFALVLLRLPVASDWPRVVALAALAALAHGFGGSAWQVALAFWPFVVYAAALYAWRVRSLGDSYLVTAAIHMLFNGAMFAAGVLAHVLAGG